DLGTFAVANETVGTHEVMYLAWTRNNLSGTTNFDFEINKLAQPNMTTAGSKALARSVGDLLISYDFQGGAQKPTLTLRRWTASNGGGGASVLGSNVADGDVNRVTIANTLGGGGNLAAFTFGEAGIDLTAAGVIPAAGTPGASCIGFGSAYVKSRSSNSFP